jgi:hypothetical protein
VRRNKSLEATASCTVSSEKDFKAMRRDLIIEHSEIAGEEQSDLLIAILDVERVLSVAEQKNIMLTGHFKF